MRAIRSYGVIASGIDGKPYGRPYGASYGANALHQPDLHPIFSYWIG